MQPGKTCRGAQLPELRLLLTGDAHGFAIEFLGGIVMPLPEQQTALLPVQLCRQPALRCPSRYLQCIVQQGQTLFDLAADLTRPGEESRKWGVHASAPVAR